ncbi:MAG: FAD-dependent oxidoreductase, partial [Planctomycetes bacterium]|nr:FAD-dependent oxidoreductase [Planctomycetota bacterium]
MSTRSHAFESVFSVIHDVAIVGGGYAALAAAQTAAAAGRSVLVIDRQAALAWESGWAMSGEVGSSDGAGWKAWMESLLQRGAARAGMIDGALAEICAHDALRRCGARLLGYASLMDIERDGDLIRALIVGTKSGMRRVVARQWIDASEDGELLGLADPRWQPPGAVDRSIQLYFRHDHRPLPSTTVVACAALPGADLVWSPTLWSDESMVRVRLPAVGGDARSAWVPALAAVRDALPDAMARAVLTHGSVLPFPRYGAISSHASPAANLAQAVPSLSATGCATIAERFRLGELAAAALAPARRAAPSATVFDEPIAEPAAAIERAEVVVAGTGTGGGLAAIAAARAGATVIAVEPL